VCAAASEGDLRLLIFGLVLKHGHSDVDGQPGCNLINRFAWLSYVGAAVIAWTGGPDGVRGSLRGEARNRGSIAPLFTACPP